MGIWKNIRDLFLKSSREDLRKLRFLAYDTVPIQIPNTSLFKDSSESDFKKVTEFSEYEILELLLSKVDFKEIIFEELGLPKNNIKVLQQVNQPLISNSNLKPGDLDVVLYRKDAIKKAIAIEAKCIKAKTLPNGEVVLNKEKNVTKGISQVNEYLQFGFHRTFLLIILLDDGQYIKGFNQFFRNTDLSGSTKLFNQNILQNLHRDVGLLYLKVNQITGKSILQSGKISLLTAKIAKKKKQKKTTTNAISSLQLDG